MKPTDFDADVVVGQWVEFWREGWWPRLRRWFMRKILRRHGYDMWRVTQVTETTMTIENGLGGEEMKPSDDPGSDRRLWVPCLRCDGYVCMKHYKHVHDCDCPPIEELGFDPYQEGRFLLKKIDEGIERVLREMGPFFDEWMKRENAPRRTCSICYFETGLYDKEESHAPGCLAAPKH